MIIGGLFSFMLTQYLLPPIISLLQDRTDATLIHATKMGITVCEERFGDILELRMEDNPEMNAASKKEAIEQIKKISLIIPGIQMLIIDKDSKIIGSSFKVAVDQFVLQKQIKSQNSILIQSLGDYRVRLNYQLFPFWRWHVVSIMFDDDYMEPILMAKQVVYIGTFGVLFIALLTMLVLFIWRINRPLKSIIQATEEISKGNLKPLSVKGKDEISQVSLAFNFMVNSLAQDKEKISTIIKELKNSEEQYRVLTEFSLANIAMIQKDEFVFANKMMLKSVKLNYKNFMGKKFWEIIHPKDRDWVTKKIFALQNDSLEKDHFECRVSARTGETLWFELLATLILYKEKNAILIHAIDITTKKKEQLERRKLEKKLTRAQKMEAIGTLAGGVAHDLNNVLSGIVGYPDLMLFDMAQDDPYREPIETIQKSGLKAAAIVQDLLTLARRGVAISGVVNLNAIVSEYLKSPEYDKLISFHPKVELETHFESDLLNMTGSQVHLSKTIMNLVSNAAESMPDGGKIIITTKNQYIDTPIGNYHAVEEGDFCVLTILDTGIGISPEDLEKIFEPFYTKKVMGRSGTGLGMAVVWGTVKDHNGYIDMQSSKGKGSVFSVYFPITREKINTDTTFLSIEDCKGNGEKILIVDDIKEQLDIASRMLEQLNYSVCTASSGEEAVQYMKENNADLMVLDMIMEPGMDGFSTYKKILELHPNQKAIIASGFSETCRVKNAQKLGVGEYLKKPYKINELGLAVKLELEKSSVL